MFFTVSALLQIPTHCTKSGHQKAHFLERKEVNFIASQLTKWHQWVTQRCSDQKINGLPLCMRKLRGLTQHTFSAYYKQRKNRIMSHTGEFAFSLGRDVWHLNRVQVFPGRAKNPKPGWIGAWCTHCVNTQVRVIKRVIIWQQRAFIINMQY